MIRLFKANKKKLSIIVVFLLISVPIGMFLYHANKPIFLNNYIEDNFEDQIIGIFPMGWLSVVKPFNVKIVSNDGNKVMEVRGTNTEVTEIARRFKKTSIGIIECAVRVLNTNARFAIHIPQLDREYNPFDDIIIIFLEGGIYVVGEDNIITLDKDPSFWEKIILLNDDISWAIDEQSLEDSTPIMVYNINLWYSIKIEFNREYFTLIINENNLGAFNYPKYNPPYFASLYFIAIATPYNFKFHVDNVKITLSHSVDYIHIGNIALLLIMSIVAIGSYILYKKRKKR